LALRARIVLCAAEGLGNTQVAERLGVRRGTVARWRSRFVVDGLDGLLDEPRPGRPRTVTDDQVEAVITTTLESTPRDATHWSTRSMAAEVGLSQSAVARIWRAFGLQPHRQDSWKLSKDVKTTADRRSVRPCTAGSNSAGDRSVPAPATSPARPVAAAHGRHPDVDRPPAHLDGRPRPPSIRGQRAPTAAPYRRTDPCRPRGRAAGLDSATGRPSDPRDDQPSGRRSHPRHPDHST
jgi:transposase